MRNLKTIDAHAQTLLASYPQDSDEMLAEILEKAQASFLSWKQSSIDHRASLVLAVAADIRSQKRQLAELMAQEMGKPISQGIQEVEKCAWLCEYYAQTAAQHLADEIIESDAQQSFVSYDPLGVILGIMPWNYPFWQVFRFAIPTLLAGNTVVLKHAEITTGCSMAMQKIFLDNGFPNYTFTSLRVSSSRMDQVVSNKHVKAVSLTGSEAAGSHVAALAGKHIKPSLLELGGNNAFIVLADADLDRAVEDAITGRFQNTGQSCIAAKRIFVQSDVYDAFIEKFVAKVKAFQVGNPLASDTFIGPMASVSLAEELEQQLQDSLEDKAKLHCGGQRDGALFHPTVVSEVRPGMRLFDEETFGPVASITRITHFKEGIDLANTSYFGLGTSVYTSNPEEVLKRVGDFEDGALFINSIVKSDPRLPFGGTKHSGYGRELSREGIRAFTNKKTVYLA